MVDKYDERGRQEKALKRWEDQQKMWAKLEANLAKRVGKSDPASTLPGSIHHFRLRQEEATVVDASVPPEIKSGHHAWEMNLRNYDINATGRTGGGFRYVQFGVPFPYPLYVPVRDGVPTDPESNTLTRVIPLDHVAPRHKPISESQYYHQRQGEYKKHIKRIFSHFVPGQEGLVVYGRPPPLINSKVLSDGTSEECFQPVVFYPPPEPRSAVPDNKSSTPINEVAVQREQTGLRSRSSIAPSEGSAVEEKKKSGPSLTISAASVVAKVRPGELAQLTLCAANAGTTAIFYQWSPRDRDPVPGLSDKPPTTFEMADVPTGVLLPGDQKLFTFSYRPLAAGSYSQTMDLNTVPAGKERILVHLQVFAISEDSNAAVTKAINEACGSREIKGALREELWGPVSAVSNNILTQSDLRSTIRLLESKQKKPETDQNLTIEKDKVSWSKNSLAATSLPSASCPFREAHAHSLQAVKDGRNSAPLVQQNLNAAPSDGAVPLPIGHSSALANPSNAGLFAVERIEVPYHKAVHGKMKSLFKNLQIFKAQCASQRDAASRLEPRPPPVPIVPEGRPRSGGMSTKAQQQFQQQQALLLAQQERPRANNRSDTPCQTVVAAVSIPPHAIGATFGVGKVYDPQLDQIVAQGRAVERALKGFETALEELEGRDSPLPLVDTYRTVSTPPRSGSPVAASSSPIAVAGSVGAGSITGPTATYYSLAVRAKNLEWDGSVRMLLEEISHVRDAEVRNNFICTLQLLMRAAVASGEGYSSSSSDLTSLLEAVAVHDALEEAAESIDHFAHTAKGISEGRVGRRIVPDAKDRGKGQAKKGVGPGKVGARPTSSEGRSQGNAGDEMKLPLVVDTFFSGAGNIYEEAVLLQIKARKTRYLKMVATVCDQPVTVTHHCRLEMIRHDFMLPHADVDTVIEPTKKKR